MANPIFIAKKSDEAEFERLEDGMHDAVCVAVVGKDFVDFNDKTKMVTKIYFVFQVTDQGSTYYFKSKPCKPIIGEKSNLFITIQGWTGTTYDHFSESFDSTKMLSYGAQLVITTKPGKDGKMYSDVANILKPKKGVKTPVTPDAIPAYLVRGAVAYELAPGITVKEDIAPVASTQAKQPFGTVTPQPAPAPAVPQQEQAPQVDDGDEDLPF